MSDSKRATPELLLDQVSWMRGLARRLVSDASLADDLVQEAVVVALERPPRDTSRLRAWLARVLRSKVREERRSNASRRRREEERPVPALPEATDDLLERLHVQRAVADTLLELEEPYRSTILLRFYEDLPPRSIAERQGVPVTTVKSRLHRGLERLRERLDARHEGDRGAWVLALLPFVREPLALAAGATAATKAGTSSAGAPLSGAGKGVVTGVSSLGGFVVNTKAALCLVAGVLAGGAWFAMRGLDRDAEGAPVELAERESVGPLSATDAPPAIGMAPEREADAAERVAVAEALPVPEDVPVAVLETHLVRGRVLDAEALPIDGLDLTVEGADGVLIGPPDVVERGGPKSQGGGRFTFETEARKLTLDVGDEGWVAVRQGFWTAGSTLDPLVVAAPATRISGQVRDENGVVLQGARIVLVLPVSLPSRMQEVADASIQIDWRGWSDEDGSFGFERAPLVPGMRLFVAKDGFEPSWVEGDRDLGRLEIVLVRSTVGDGPSVQGRIVLPDGAPATEARVAMGLGSVPVDEEGFFSLDLERAINTDQLLASQPGYQSVRMDRPGERDEELAGWPPFVELVLGPEPLAIRGHLVDADGEPCEGAYVWIEDPTPFGTVGTLPLFLEAWGAGGGVPRRAMDSVSNLPEQDGDENFGSATPIAEPNAMLFYVRTNPDGGFAIEGLADREYTLRAIDDELRFNVTSEAVRAGTNGFVFRVPKPQTHPFLEGRVVTRHGDPVEGVRVLQWTAAMDHNARVFGGRAQVTRFLMGPETVSDADGRIRFTDIPKERIEFYVASDEILPTYASIEDVEDPSAAEIVVAARAHLSVTVEPSDAVDAIHVTDVQGNRQKILLMRADGYSNFDDYELTDGRSGVVTVNSDAAYLNLVYGGEVVDTLPLVLRPGEVERIDVRL